MSIVENDNFNSDKLNINDSLENKKCSMHCDQFDSKLKASEVGPKLAYYCLKTGIEINSGDNCRAKQVEPELDK